jgi:cytochrome c biogenesis factor
MRKLAIIVPVAMVAGFVIYDTAKDDKHHLAVAEATALTVVEVPAVPDIPAVPVVPEITAIHEAQLAELATLSTQLADLAVAIPAVEIDAEALADFRIHAGAKADVAAAVSGFVELLEQQKYNGLNEEQIVELTGSMLADIAANLEAFLTIEMKEGKVRVVRDSGGGR